MDTVPPVVWPVLVVVVAIIYLTIKDASECKPLIDAVHDNDIQEVRSLLQAGHHPDCQDRNGWTPLCHVSKLGYRDMASELLHAKSDPSRPLFIAAEHGDPLIVATLIKHGANPNDSHMGQTPLHIAVRKNNRNVLSTLLEAKADPNAKYQSRTSLHYAVEKGVHAIVSILLRYKADPNIADEMGRTSLHIAAEIGEAWCVSMLLYGGANFQKLYMKKTPLQVAIENNNKAAAAVLDRPEEELRKIYIENKAPQLMTTLRL